LAYEPNPQVGPSFHAVRRSPPVRDLGVDMEASQQIADSELRVAVFWGHSNLLAAQIFD